MSATLTLPSLRQPPDRGRGLQGSGPPDPAEMRSRVPVLIEGAASNGRLASDQASTLERMLSQSPNKGGDDDTRTTGSAASGEDAGDRLASFLRDRQ